MAVCESVLINFVRWSTSSDACVTHREQKDTADGAEEEKHVLIVLARSLACSGRRVRQRLSIQCPLRRPLALEEEVSLMASVCKHGLSLAGSEVFYR